MASPKQSLAGRARDILRLNAYASFAAAAVVLAAVIPPAGRAGVSIPAVAGFGAALALAGGDELFLSVGRRLRRLHVVPPAVLNTASAAACLALIVGSDGLPILGRVAVSCTALLLAAFALIETRAARSL